MSKASLRFRIYSEGNHVKYKHLIIIPILISFSQITPTSSTGEGEKDYKVPHVFRCWGEMDEKHCLGSLGRKHFSRRLKFLHVPPLHHLPEGCNKKGAYDPLPSSYSFELNGLVTVPLFGIAQSQG